MPQVEALQLAVSSSMRRASMADAFTGTTPRSSRFSVDHMDEATSPMAPLSEEDFHEHPKAIALQSQLSILRRTITALHRGQAASEQASALACILTAIIRTPQG